MRALVRRIVLAPLALEAIYLRFISLFKPEWAGLWKDNFRAALDGEITVVGHIPQDSTILTSELQLKFVTPNEVTRFRAHTFAAKEPETLAWIDEYGGSGVFFDVGANVGLYSIYYALSHSGDVYAFEPSFFNVELLSKNIALNHLEDRIVIVSNPLTDDNRVADFSVSSQVRGGALNSFGEVFGHDGEHHNSVLRYRTLGVNLDFLLTTGVLPAFPSMIKIDVDGIEHLVLAGAQQTLSNPTLRTLLIEVNDAFEIQAKGVAAALAGAGFEMISKSHSEMFSQGEYSSSYNQIWHRDP